MFQHVCFPQTLNCQATLLLLASPSGDLVYDGISHRVHWNELSRMCNAWDLSEAGAASEPPRARAASITCWGESIHCSFQMTQLCVCTTINCDFICYIPIPHYTKWCDSSTWALGMFRYEWMKTDGTYISEKRPYLFLSLESAAI